MVLNPRLFAALEKHFGKGEVRINRAGQKMVPEYVQGRDEENQLRLRIRRKTTGEEYQVRCPRCRDYKRRLSISHRWGVRDSRTGSRCLHFIQCWNEECFRSYDVIRKFYDMLMGGEDLAFEEPESRGLEVRKKPEMPGKLWRLDRLAEKVPRHAAVQYARDRLLSVETLGEQFGVGYCPEPWMQEASNRLIAPIKMGGKLLGWSGRYIGDTTDEERIPKWYHDPAMEKSELLYNYDTASQLPTKAVVEGCGDTWGIGRIGLGILGNRISGVQVDLLLRCSSQEGTSLVLLLDPKQGAKDLANKKRHHMEVAWEVLTQQHALAGKLVKVYLSDDLDPGDADRAYQYGLIRYCAAQQGVSVQLPED